MSDDLATLVAVCEKAAKSKFSVTIDPVAVLPVVRKAATALSEARAEIERLRRDKSAGFAFWRSIAKRFCNARKAALDRALAAESELSTLRDMLVLCGELGGMGKDETPANYLRRLIDEVAGKEAECMLAAAQNGGELCK